MVSPFPFPFAAAVAPLVVAAALFVAPAATAAPVSPAMARVLAAQGIASPPAATLHKAGAAPRATPRRDSPDVFGSVALPVAHTRLNAKWQAASRTLSNAGGSAATLVAAARSLSREDQAATVNAWVNTRVNFRADRDGRDRWAAPAETLATRQGDCEDFALSKLALLEALGVSRRDLFLVIAFDLVRRQDHAVLVMRSGESLLLLDSAGDRVTDAREPSDYRPIVTFSADQTWVHGYATQPAAGQLADADTAGAAGSRSRS